MAGVQTQSVTPLSVLGLTDGVKMSELMQAAFFGDPKRCFERLGLGDDPNEASESCHGFTPLMLAVLSKNEEVLRVLLHHGALRAPKNRHGHTAAGLATFVGHHDCSAFINNFVPLEVFTAIATAERNRVGVDNVGAQWLYLYFQTADVVPSQLHAILSAQTDRPKSETLVQISALLPTLARIALRQWARPAIALKALLFRGVITGFAADPLVPTTDASAAALAALGTPNPETEPEFVELIAEIRRSDDPFMAVASCILGSFGVQELDAACATCRCSRCTCQALEVLANPSETLLVNCAASSALLSETRADSSSE